MALTRLFAPWVAYALAAFIALGLAIYVGKYEGEPANVLFTLAATAGAAALVAIVTRRALFAVFVVAALVFFFAAVAYLKQQTTDVTLHAYDVVTFLETPSSIVELWRNHAAYVPAIVLAAIITAALAAVIYRLDGSRLRRGAAFGGLLLSVGVALLTADTQEARRHMGFYYEHRQLWFFFSSWIETFEALWRGHILDAGAHKPSSKLRVPASCTLPSKAPHIVLIHQESVVPPSHFPSLGYDREIDTFFRSYDGKLHNLRVETYGGASWLSEFSILTGLSAHSLGNLRQFAQTIMAGKVRETLPHALARCGYRNVAFHPMLRIYLSIGNFLKAVGIHQLFDAKDQQATSAFERDKFYYSNVLAEMERHFASSNAPLFAFIETQATHGPYSYTYMPEVTVVGGEPGTDPAMHEYLRRLAMARLDYDFFRSELVGRFPDQSFLIVHYGDHQPTATLTLLGFDSQAGIEDVLRSGKQDALITYYAIEGVRFQPLPLPSLSIVDIPYLPAIILHSAGLPLSEVSAERLRLMRQCDGRYHGCPEIPIFHRRLIESGVIDAM